MNPSINNEIKQSFEATIGIKQGCVLSPLLFSIMLDSLGE